MLFSCRPCRREEGGREEGSERAAAAPPPHECVFRLAGRDGDGDVDREVCRPMRSVLQRVADEAERWLPAGPRGSSAVCFHPTEELESSAGFQI